MAGGQYPVASEDFAPAYLNSIQMQHEQAKDVFNAVMAKTAQEYAQNPDSPQNQAYTAHANYYNDLPKARVAAAQLSKDWHEEEVKRQGVNDFLKYMSAGGGGVPSFGANAVGLPADVQETMKQGLFAPVKQVYDEQVAANQKGKENAASQMNDLLDAWGMMGGSMEDLLGAGTSGNGQQSANGQDTAGALTSGAMLGSLLSQPRGAPVLAAANVAAATGQVGQPTPGGAAQGAVSKAEDGDLGGARSDILQQLAGLNSLIPPHPGKAPTAEDVWNSPYKTPRELKDEMDARTREAKEKDQHQFYMQKLVDAEKKAEQTYEVSKIRAETGQRLAQTATDRLALDSEIRRGMVAVAGKNANTKADALDLARDRFDWQQANPPQRKWADNRLKDVNKQITGLVQAQTALRKRGDGIMADSKEALGRLKQYGFDENATFQSLTAGLHQAMIYDDKTVNSLLKDAATVKTAKSLQDDAETGIQKYTDQIKQLQTLGYALGAGPRTTGGNPARPKTVPGTAAPTANSFISQH